MPSSSTWSDFDLVRVHAREKHHVLQRNPTPPPKQRQDSTVLSSIGSHLTNTSEPDSWPSSIENFTDDEACSPSTPSTPRALDASHGSEVGMDDGSLECSLTSRTRAHIGDVSYLPVAEYKLLVRYRTSKQNMKDIGNRSSEPSPTRQPTSKSDAMQYRTHRGEIPERTYNVHVAFSASHTAPPMSVGTVEEDGVVSVQLPGADDPWSPINMELENTLHEGQEKGYTVSRRHREHSQTPMS
ncbi:hypothetical protein T440DRAFT_387262 [Plenodomus tracheiphilus IPT5]|uniref:Uncharacterized protein n=1 Tax=Plenodomus tracheiphilus IPT5 TaxID=1408161 RepID=A0A6A7BHP6_9PLEO|nr:hypothetical protein T440DRAFT_387262 [Plenodomus tracheiphilus IPT5]